jgi:hypothetical protein
MVLNVIEDGGKKITENFAVEDPGRHSTLF